jgi:hypothetical protein
MDARDLELENMSVYDFVNQASYLLGEDDQAAFVRFALTGRHEGKQAVVDAILNSLPNSEELGVTRDYDSLLGIDKDIRVTGSLTVYPVSKKEDVLCKNVHIHYDFSSTRVRCFLFTSIAWITDGFLGSLYCPHS